MKNTKLIVYLLLSVFIAAGCQKQVSNPVLSTDKELLEFSIEDTLNRPYIPETIRGTIDENEIKISVPEITDATKLIASFKFKGEGVYIGSTKQESGKTVNDFSAPLTYTVIAEDQSRKDYRVNISLVPELKSTVPHIYIETDGGAAIDSKDTYVKGNIRIEGNGLYDDYEGRLSIKGRGNTTWYYPKKPYRIKLDKKAPLLGLSEEKDWILLANYLDETLMCNAIAFKAARLLDMPFTNHIIPVDVTLNGTYIGNYMFTEQKEVEDNRINVGKDGTLLELDTNFDEAYKFYSKNYKLPVMIQYPELDKLPADEANAKLAEITNNFNSFEDLLASNTFPNNDLLNYFDAGAFADYMVVYLLTDNEELNHPKSTYIYKTGNGKYSMGPVWDFDWGFGYQSTYSHFTKADSPLIWATGLKGYAFFSRLMLSPQLKSLIKTRWNEFKATKFSKLIHYINEYAGIIKDSFARDYAVWKNGSGDLNAELQLIISWLNNRASYIDDYVSGF